MSSLGSHQATNSPYFLPRRIVITKEHEPKLYETLLVIAGLFFKFTIVKLKGPNKNH